MDPLKISVRFIVFVIMVVIGTFMVEFMISYLYKLLLTYYSLPKTEFNLTFLSFSISFVFFTFLSMVSDYWGLSKAV